MRAKINCHPAFVLSREVCNHSFLLLPPICRPDKAHLSMSNYAPAGGRTGDCKNSVLSTLLIYFTHTISGGGDAQVNDLPKAPSSIQNYNETRNRPIKNFATHLKFFADNLLVKLWIRKYSRLLPKNLIDVKLIIIETARVSAHLRLNDTTRDRKIKSAEEKWSQAKELAITPRLLLSVAVP